jgi:hypothetical protein
MPQIDGHLVAPRRRGHAVFGEHRGLVLEDFRLVDLEHRGARGPVQPVGARIQSRGQDDDLADPGGGGRG